MSKKKRKFKKSILWIICLVLFSIILIYQIELKENSIFEGVQSQSVNIEKYFIYGTHLNIKGKIENTDISDIKDVKFILKNKKIENEYNCEYKIDKNNIEIATSSLLNEGIDLEKLNKNKYYIFVKIYYKNDENKMYSLKSDDSENLEYYTITKNHTNKKIDLKFENFISKQKNLQYMMLNVTKTVLPNDVYDISIDPGHGGSDPGATYSKYKESDLALKYSMELKKELENIGLKVLITRDGTEDTSQNSKFNVYSVYDKDGRVNLVGKSKAKYNLSIHLNSLDTNVLNGTEIYAPSNASLDIAKSLADNIVSIANTNYSTRDIDKVLDGVYVRNYTENEIKESEANAKKNGYQKYNLTTSTPYLYMIREVGGIATEAYVDGRNKIYGTNEFYNSKIGVESYLIELGYIINQKDLDNMLNNQEKYIKAIKQTVEEKIVNK